MKKRLRKKLHLREFSEYGIDFKLQVKPPITDKDFDTLID